MALSIHTSAGIHTLTQHSVQANRWPPVRKPSARGFRLPVVVAGRPLIRLCLLSVSKLSWVLFVASQLPLAFFTLAFFWSFLGSAQDDPKKKDRATNLAGWSLISTIFLGILDGLVLTGVIGPGWPIRSAISAAYLGICLLIWAFVLVSLKETELLLMLAIFVAGLVLCAVLLDGITHWLNAPVHISDQVTPTPNSTPIASSTTATQKPNTAIGGIDWGVVWTAIGAIGALIGGIAAVVFRQK
jgi:hypothetical protein